MLKLIEGAQAHLFPNEIDAMFRSRAEIFRDRLGWDVVVKDGKERDGFDDCNPLYLISVHPKTGIYQGSLRLLPTTGPNMLRDVFSPLRGDHPPIESRTIWESSRICVAKPEEKAERVGANLNVALLELLSGIADVGARENLTQIVSVFDARMFRILRHVGLRLEVIGTPQKIGKVMSYAALFEIHGGWIDEMRAKFRVDDPTQATEMNAPESFETAA
jgi:acyl homoserine lactone synthase